MHLSPSILTNISPDFKNSYTRAASRGHLEAICAPPRRRVPPTPPAYQRRSSKSAPQATILETFLTISPTSPNYRVSRSLRPSTFCFSVFTIRFSRWETADDAAMCPNSSQVRSALRLQPHPPIHTIPARNSRSEPSPAQQSPELPYPALPCSRFGSRLLSSPPSRKATELDMGRGRA